MPRHLLTDYRQRIVTLKRQQSGASQMGLTSFFDKLPTLKFAKGGRPDFPQMLCDHKKLALPGDTRDNLLKLADYLRGLPLGYKDFEMAHFMRDHNLARELPNTKSSARQQSCGTSACAVGHGPSAGIPAEDYESWPRYANRVFLQDSDSLYGFGFLFAAEWRWTDNTPQGAANRIYYALQHGVPHENCRGLPCAPYLFTNSEQFYEA